MSSTVRRMYSSRTVRTYPTSPPSTLPSPPVRASSKTYKRSKSDSDDEFLPSTKRRRLAPLTNHKNIKAKAKKRDRISTSLTQLHFSIDATVLVSCPSCGLTYTKGAPDDEALHRSHCTRVQRGMEWGREEEKEAMKDGVIVVQNGARLKDGRRGRIISFRADVGGKIGNKLNTLLDTLNRALSAPSLTPRVLHDSKAYLFLLPCPKVGREKIIGCALAQRIETAMALAPTSVPTSKADERISRSVATLFSVELDPRPLPTPLGIPRVFTAMSYRKQGVAMHLLNVAARSAVHGCVLDPKHGQIAFTQPTDSGRALMEKWGEGAVRVYEE